MRKVLLLEGRDVQHLLGLLVDQGVVSRRAIGVTGISYGGILTHNLARLRDRVRLTNGAYRPWRSPRGTPLEVNAAWARWGATDLTYALTPNGRFLDFGPFSPRALDSSTRCFAAAARLRDTAASPRSPRPVPRRLPPAGPSAPAAGGGCTLARSSSARVGSSA